jgi:hypothetical protein
MLIRKNLWICRGFFMGGTGMGANSIFGKSVPDWITVMADSSGADLGSDKTMPLNLLREGTRLG